MRDLLGSEGKTDILALVANVAGIASLVLAVANGNLDKLSSLQRWGLAIASAVMFWAFFIGSLVKLVKSQAGYTNQALAASIMFFGGIICAALLLAILPMFAFGLPADQHDLIAMCAAGTFLAFTLLIAFFTALSG
jgi:hypothetical protein